MADRVKPPAPAPTSGETVVVACKLPNGLILRLFHEVDETEATPQGNRTVKVHRQRQDVVPVRLNGSATPYAKFPDYPVHHGYALTVVDAGFWHEWCRQNHDAEVLRNKLVFAHEKPEQAQGQAQEQHKDKVRSGLEPIDPKNPPAVGLGMRVTQAEKAA